MKRGLEQPLLASLARANSRLLFFYVAFRLGDLAWRGQLGLAFAGDVQAMAFWLELGLGALVPAILMAQPNVRANKNALFAAGGMVVAGGILNRLCVSWIGLLPYTGPIYVPSWSEVVLSLALVMAGVAIFGAAVRMLPVFPKEEEPAAVLA